VADARQGLVDSLQAFHHLPDILQPGVIEGRQTERRRSSRNFAF
jgi:hypothetical protein